MGKKIGIITMHKVVNYGSALQAYALQKVLEDMGNEVEIIDYIFPNEYHKKYQPRQKLWRILAINILNLFRKSNYKKKVESLELFYHEHLNLTRTYSSRDELKNFSPHYDIYMTGSDQVWNPESIYKDTSFMLSFTDSPNKVAYSASFAKGEIPEQYKELYATELRKYKKIFMREQKGCEIVKDLIGKETEVVLDPTFLLNKQQWLRFAEQSTLQINEPYILVYVLGYSFNVYPYIYDLITHVQKTTKMKLAIIQMDKRYIKRLSNKILVQNISIFDFVKLFSNASMVLTDSFHGTAFSLNMGVPFYSVANQTDDADTRIMDLLKLTGESSRIIRKDSNYKNIVFDLSIPKHEKLVQLRKDSICKLSQLL